MTDPTPASQPGPPLRIVGFFAHPDDAEFTCGGSAAVWSDQGAEVIYVVVTNGAAGSNEPGRDLAELVKIREAEQRAACAVTGVREVIFLGYPDGTLQPTLELRRDITRLIRRLKPDRVVCGDPSVLFYGDGYINHPDHHAVDLSTVYAVYPCAVSRPIFPELLDEGLEPHQVKELYLASDDKQVTTHVDISSAIERKIEALRCHKSQLDVGDGQWIREWAGEVGKAAGLPYAEAFRVITLIREEGGRE
ncbi:MAG TPA: PIG-L deacetylase family protein [Caldilineaceae bacterium]|nr:PIG-L deacetylase family protein [Caldilineaceae bacterium]